MAFPAGSNPQSAAGIGINVKFIWDNTNVPADLAQRDWGRLFSKIRFRGTMN
jgi:hypothetical protein